jgi:hypothetical protein
MKKIILLSLISLFSLAGFSQSYTISNRNSLLSGTPSSDHFESIITITNTSNADIKYTWYKLSQNLQTGWTTQLCDPVTCFDPIPDSNNFTLKAGKSSTFSVKVNPNNISGLGKITLGLKVDGTNNFDTITFNINSWALGVNNNLSKLPELSVYPNPAQNEININFDSKFSYQVEILNIIGNRVKVISNLEGHSKLDVSDLPDGVYIVRLNDRGRLLTRRITKS